MEIEAIHSMLGEKWRLRELDLAGLIGLGEVHDGDVAGNDTRWGEDVSVTGDR